MSENSGDKNPAGRTDPWAAADAAHERIRVLIQDMDKRNARNDKPLINSWQDFVGVMVLLLAVGIGAGGAIGLCIGLAVFLVRFLWGLGQ